ncbi:MAG TPA: hypothetical protein VFF27_06600 [Bacteroidia bacterium]|jgi:hypothetical protein|nr:hypothetical protein [Bacteroidia bacterium]
MKSNAIFSLVFSILLITSVSCLAQDTLVKKDGQLLIGKVLEVSPTEVKYKKADFPDGPTYTEIKATLERIKYRGGQVDVFPEVKSLKAESKPEDDYRQQPTKKREDDYRSAENSKIVKLGGYYKQGDNFYRERQVQKILLKVNDPEINYRIKKARIENGLRYIGFAAIPVFAGSLMMASLASSSTKAYPNSREPLNIFVGGTVVSGILLGTSIYLNIDRKVNNAKAVHIYNEHFAK